MTDWSRLPEWLAKQIEDARDSLETEHTAEMTLKLRERIKVWRDILKFGEDDEPLMSFDSVAEDFEDKEGYDD